MLSGPILAPVTPTRRPEGLWASIGVVAGTVANRYIGDDLPDLLSRFRIDLVLDVGANAGQFALELFGAGYPGDIVSFEPLSDAHALLLRASRDDPRWTIGRRCALGDRSGVTMLNIAGNSQSSSLLPMLAAHQQAAPASRYVGAEQVEVRRLDDLVRRDDLADRRVFLKLDVQGYERHVVDGAGGLVNELTGIQFEMDVEQLYDGGALMGDMLSLAAGMGFSLYSLKPGFRDQSDGRLLQVDGVFFRSDRR